MWWKVRSDALPERACPLLIFTDLDGTLLDHDTYRWDEAQPALSLCRKQGVPVILVSSKTRAEIHALHVELGLAAPFVYENGGGIFFPLESALEPPAEALLIDGLRKWPLGSPYPELVAALREIREELRWTIRGFSDMTVGEISRLTGLDPERARLAAMREYDEPFTVLSREGVDRERLDKAAARRGLRVTEGGRFFHLHGACDKGQALDKLVHWYEKSCGPAKIMALGDGPNDFTMLKRADYPVLVKSSQTYPELFKEIPSLKGTEEAGPAGWNAAVKAVLAVEHN
jgi:mannosyl-3-phosphoglycerate phosphatase